jgi:predicted Fe-Mo cluster-binding NifX family protein
MVEAKNTVIKIITGARKMKLVFASTGSDLESALDSRFGRCPCLVCYDTESKEVNSVNNSQNLNAVQGAGIQAATTVAALGAEYIFCGHCGPKAFRVFEAANRDYLQGQIGNPDGADKPNKKYYDPRNWLRKGQESLIARLKVAFDDLNPIDRN